jgi:hypothetical protein
LLFIDPGRNPGLAKLYEVHAEFVHKATEQALWHCVR